jgi:hypothetical protein
MAKNIDFMMGMVNDFILKKMILMFKKNLKNQPFQS